MSVGVEKGEGRIGREPRMRVGVMGRERGGESGVPRLTPPSSGGIWRIFCHCVTYEPMPCI